MASCQPELPDDQPAQRYSTALGLKVVDRRHLKINERPLPAFHNNLTVRSSDHDILFVANHSCIEMYRMDAITGAPTDTMMARIETKPEITTQAMIRGANWELRPHGINFMNLFILDGQEVIGTAGDDGRVLIYSVRRLVRRLNNAKPNYCIQVTKSAWGLDIDPQQRLVAISSNSAHVSIFQLGSGGHHSLLVVSPFLLDNIPDVKFVDTSASETCRIAAITITGFVVVWEFYYGDKLHEMKKELARRNYRRRNPKKFNEKITAFRSASEFMSDLIDMEPSSELTDHNEFDIELDEEMENDDDQPMIHDLHGLLHEGDVFTSDYGICLASDNLRQQGWTLNCVSSCDFKKVPSLYEAVGNKWINEEILFERPQQQSDDMTEEDLYQQMRFVSFEIETQFIQRSDAIAHTTSSGVPFYALAPLRSRDKKRKEYLRRQLEPSKNRYEGPKDKFLIMTSKKGLYLCQLEDLYCNAARSNVFCFDSHRGLESMQLDRLSIVKVIKELSAVVVVSQLGAVSVFRLTQYRGIFSLRQEYVFPDVEDMLFYGPLLIAGVTCSPRKHSSGFISSVYITVIYIDGLTITYELFVGDDGEDGLLL